MVLEKQQTYAKREKYIDVIKGIAILLMVLGHCGCPEVLRVWIYGFHMPLFFFLSGYLYHADKWNKLGIFTFIRRRARDYLIPYVGFGLLNIVLNIPLDYANGWDAIGVLKGHLLWLCTVSDKYIAAQSTITLWFLPCLFLCNVIFRCFMAVNNRIGRIIFSVLLVTTEVFFFTTKLLLPWHLDLVALGTLFMLIGYWIRVGNGLEHGPVWGILALVIGMVAIFTNTTSINVYAHVLGNPVVMLIGATTTTYAVFWISKHWIRKSYLLQFFGRNTLIVMGTHIFIMNCMLFLMNHIPVLKAMGYQWWIITIGVLIFCFAISLFWEKRNLFQGKSILWILLIGVGLAFLFFPPRGHDSEYWISRIASLGIYIHNYGIGALPQRVMTDVYDAYGYGAPLYYGDFHLLLPAWLYANNIGMKYCYGLELAIIWFGRCAIVWYCSRELCRRYNCQGQEVWLVFLYCFSPYMLEQLIVRLSLGEAVAWSFAPLVFLSVERIMHDENDKIKNTLILAVGLWAVLCSHVLSTVMIAIVCVIIVIACVRHAKNRKWIWQLGAAGGVAILLSAYWLFPFLEQYLSHNISMGAFEQAEFVSERLRLDEWLFPFIFKFVYVHRMGEDYISYYPSCLAYLLLLAIIVYCCRNKKGKEYVKELLIVAFAILCVMTFKPFVELLGIGFKTMQFPWRLAGLYSLIITAVIWYGVMNTISQVRKRRVVVCLLIFALLANGYQIKENVTYILNGTQEYNYDRNHVDNLYFPNYASADAYITRGQLVTCNDSNVAFDWKRNDDYSISISFKNNGEKLSFELPLYYYLGYSVKDTIASNAMITKSANGLVEVQFEADDAQEHSLLVAYTGTTIQKVSTALSVVAWMGSLLFIIWMLIKRKKGKKCQIQEIME